MLQTPDRSLLPTSPREQVFLFSLSLSLMLNTTVVLLLMTGDLPTLAQLQAKPTPAVADRDAPANVPERSQPVEQPSQPTAIDRVPAVISTSAWQNDQPMRIEPQPLAEHPALVSVTPAVVSPEPAPQTQPIEPTQDDDPITFFGIGIE